MRVASENNSSADEHNAAHPGDALSRKRPAGAGPTPSIMVMVVMVVMVPALNNHCAVVVMMVMMVLHGLKLRLIAHSAIPLVHHFQGGGGIEDRLQQVRVGAGF